MLLAYCVVLLAVLAANVTAILLAATIARRRMHHDEDELMCRVLGRRRSRCVFLKRSQVASKSWMLTSNPSHMSIPREPEREAQIANVLTEDEARRIASNIAKLPSLLGATRAKKNSTVRCPPSRDQKGAGVVLRPNADLDAPPNVRYWGKADMARTCPYVR